MWARTVHTKVSPVQVSYSSEAANGWLGGCCSPVLAVKKKFLLPRRKEQFSCKEWAAERNFAALGEPQLLPSCSLPSAQFCLPPPHFPLCFSHLELQPSPWVLLSLGNCMGFGSERAILLWDLLPRRVFTACPVKVTPGSRMCSGLGSTWDPGTDHSALPRRFPCFFLMCIPSFPPQHSQAARYYSVVAWIPLNACQSAQRAESELFKLHLLKDPWCLFLLFVFRNSLKS